MATSRQYVGMPCSIARYCASTTWGHNNWAVFEYRDNPLRVVCVAAQPTKKVAERYMAPGRVLIDLSTYPH